LTGEPEDSFADDVALDLVGPAADADGPLSQELLLRTQTTLQSERLAIGGGEGLRFEDVRALLAAAGSWST
jgi:hypothetical protein